MLTWLLRLEDPRHLWIKHDGSPVIMRLRLPENLTGPQVRHPCWPGIPRVTPEGLIYAVDLASAVTGYGINKAHRFLGNRKFSKSKYKKHANRKLLTPKAAIQLIWACAKNHS